MRSVVVVLPASICAMMPMLRTRSSGVVRLASAMDQSLSSKEIRKESRYRNEDPLKDPISDILLLYCTNHCCENNCERAARRSGQPTRRSSGDQFFRCEGV